jgi:hypothetical protein
MHFYYRHPGVEIRNRSHVFERSIDIRADGGYVVAPPSIHPETQTAYQWLDCQSKPWEWSLDEIPIFDPDWIDQKTRPIPVDARLPSTSIERARRYIAKIVAVSGQGGHNATFRAACKLAGMGLSEDEMLRLMLQWNESNAIPKWTEAEIRHKVKDALSPRRTVEGAGT